MLYFPRKYKVESKLDKEKGGKEGVEKEAIYREREINREIKREIKRER